MRESPLSIRAALLQALHVPGSGRTLRTRIREATGVDPSPGALYPALSSLEKGGFVYRLRGMRRPRAAGRPEIVYELTVRGVDVAMAERRTLAALFRIGSPTVPTKAQITRMSRSLEVACELSDEMMDIRDAAIRAGL